MLKSRFNKIFTNLGIYVIHVSNKWGMLYKKKSHSSSPKNIEYVTSSKPFYPHFFNDHDSLLKTKKFLLTLPLYRLMIKQLN